ncbi:MAG: hypothetical protein JXR68_04735 [Bacteroidales bacterium]|nr:hypothetical protein [Bacteroidales bacterium]
MQRYIEQIIQDLQDAKNNVPPDPELEKTESYEEFAEKMFAIETAPSQPMKKLFGVNYEKLPPPEKLTNEQMQQLIDAIEDTFSEFNIGIDFKDEIPIKLKYEVLRDEFEDDFLYMHGFHTTIDFCDGWCPECKIADYCDIKYENWTPEELEEERNKAKNKKEL